MQNKQNFGSASSLDIAENENLRSEYMRLILLDRTFDVESDRNLEIPLTIVQFWNDLSSIPLDVRECIETWRKLEREGFKHVLFDDKTALKFIKENFDSNHEAAFRICKHPAMRSDYFRLCFIMINGGFYVDADDIYKGQEFKSHFYNSRLKLHPLCYNTLTDSMVSTEDFINCPPGTRELIFYVNNNPIIAPPKHPLIQLALERSTRLLLSQGSNNKQDIQSVTGPGNLTASLVQYAAENKKSFTILKDWDGIAVSKWPLDYRKDKRNWRKWDGKEQLVSSRI